MVIWSYFTNKKIFFIFKIKNIEDICSFFYLEEIRNEVGGHEIYSFLDWFLRYYQVLMVEVYKNKIIFLVKWGPFQFERM